MCYVFMNGGGSKGSIHIQYPCCVSKVCTYNIFTLLQEPPVEPQSEAVILPGGDPDAGMPADQAEIHGTERHPVPASDTQQDTNEEGPPPDVNPNEQCVDPSELDRPPLTNEQGHPPVRTSPAEPVITDSIDEDIPADDAINNNKNITIKSLPDSA